MASLVMSYLAMFALLHLLQELLRVEIFYDATVQTIFDGSTKRKNLLLLFFQEAETGTNHFAGVVVTPARDTGLNEIFEMRTKGNGCRFHTQHVNATKLPIFHNNTNHRWQR